MKFNCPNPTCDQHLEVDEKEFAGIEFNCPRCGQLIEIDTAESEEDRGTIALPPFGSKLSSSVKLCPKCKRHISASESKCPKCAAILLNKKPKEYSKLRQTRILPANLDMNSQPPPVPFMENERSAWQKYRDFDNKAKNVLWMFLTKVYWKVVLVFIIVAVPVWKWEERKAKAEVNAQQAIVKEVVPIINSCRTAGDNIEIVGKALVWDLTRNKDLDSQREWFEGGWAGGRLENSRDATSSDKQITVFIIVRKREEAVGFYTGGSGETAYRKYADIAVVLWPDMRPIGFHVVVSEPPQTKYIHRSRNLNNGITESQDYSSVYYSEKDIAEWINGLHIAN